MSLNRGLKSAGKDLMATLHATLSRGLYAAGVRATVAAGVGQLPVSMNTSRAALSGITPVRACSAMAEVKKVLIEFCRH